MNECSFFIKQGAIAKGGSLEFDNRAAALVANLEGNVLIISEKVSPLYKNNKNEHKYATCILAFPSVNFFENLYNSRQRL